MNLSNRKFDLKPIENNIVVLTILLYLFRTTFPFLKFPFILFFSGLIIYSVINYRRKILSAFQNFVRIFYLAIALAIILIVSFLLSNKFYLLIFKDCFNAIILATLFYLMTLSIKSQRELDIFIKSLVRFIILFASLISLMLLGNFLNIFPGNDVLSSNESDWLLLIGSVSSEYNLNLIPVFLGIISIIYSLTEAATYLKKAILNFILIIYSLTILVSGSRRGLVVLGATFIVIIFVKLIALYREETNLKKLVSSSLVFLLSLSFLALLSFGLIFKSSNYDPEIRDSKNNNSIRVKLALAISRYMSIADKDVTYASVYEKIRVNGFDKDFDSQPHLVQDSIKELISGSNNRAPLFTLSNVTDQDPIRKWAAKFVLEDTTYLGYKSNLSVDIDSNKLVGDRVMRLRFAYQVFTKEYKWRQRVFGGGFNFLNWFGFYFIKDKSFSDYPHNPFFSVLLYSGIFGLIIYFIFIFKVFYYYFKYFKEYQILSVFFLITFFFSFFCGNSPFDPPIMGFFVFLPFFIHSLYNKIEQAVG